MREAAAGWREGPAQGKDSRDHDGTDGPRGAPEVPAGRLPLSFQPGRPKRRAPHAAGPRLRSCASQGLGIGAAGRDAGGLAGRRASGGDGPGLGSPRAPIPHSRRDPGSRAQRHEPQQHEQRGREGAQGHALG